MVGVTWWRRIKRVTQALIWFVVVLAAADLLVTALTGDAHRYSDFVGCYYSRGGLFSGSLFHDSWCRGFFGEDLVEFLLNVPGLYVWPLPLAVIGLFDPKFPLFNKAMLVLFALVVWAPVILYFVSAMKSKPRPNSDGASLSHDDAPSA